MGILNFLRPKNRLPVAEELYSGGSGTSTEDAIIINTDNNSDGIKAEYGWIEIHYGKRDQSWKLGSQMLLSDNEKNYDLIKIELKNGNQKSIYFNIDKFYR